VGASTSACAWAVVSEQGAAWEQVVPWPSCAAQIVTPASTRAWLVLPVSSKRYDKKQENASQYSQFASEIRHEFPPLGA
jgi:hypothetical protein